MLSKVRFRPVAAIGVAAGLCVLGIVHIRADDAWLEPYRAAIGSPSTSASVGRQMPASQLREWVLRLS